MTNNRHISSHLAFTVFCCLITTNVFAMEACPSFCKFRLCHFLFREGNAVETENRGYLLGVPSAPLGSFPCHPRPQGRSPVELRNATGGEARVSKKFVNQFAPISKFLGSKVYPPFEKDYFRWVLDRDGHSNIARKPSRGNQDSKIDRMCVQMPINSFVNRRGKLRRPKGRRVCVGFRAVVPKLLVDFEWSSPDDFDLALMEPNGDEVNRFGENTRSDNGGTLVIDNGAEVCAGRSSRERISYPADGIVERGTYKIHVDHNRICEPTTTYRLRVMHEGVVILDKSGTIANTAVPVENAVLETFTIEVEEGYLAL